LPLDRGSRGKCRHPDSHIDTPQDRAEEEASDDPPDDPDVHFSTDTQAWLVRNGAKRTAGLQDDIQRLCPLGRGPDKESFDEESFIDKVHTGTCETPQLRTGPEPPGFDNHGQRGKRAGGY